MAENLNKSFAVIFILVVLVIMQHLVHYTAAKNVWLFALIATLVLIFTFIYFLQLKNNLHSFLGISNIGIPVYILLSNYAMLYLSVINVRIVQETSLINSSFYRTIVIVSLSITLLGMISLIIQYCIIGFRLFKTKELKNLKNLGAVFLFVIPVFSVIVFILNMTKSEQMYTHVFTLFELLPYWFTYKLYSGFRKNSTKENLAGNPITFYTNERS